MAQWQELFVSTPPDPWASPMLSARLQELLEQLQELAHRRERESRAEIFIIFDRPARAEGMEAGFTAQVLVNWQKMIVSRYLTVDRRARHRPGQRTEDDDALYLMPSPCGAESLRISHTDAPDPDTNADRWAAIDAIISLLESSAESDEAFDNVLGEFHPHVVPALQGFLRTIHLAERSCRILAPPSETSLSRAQIAEAYLRVSAVHTQEQMLHLLGVFCGVILLSREFEFQPEQGASIHGTLSEEVGEAVAIGWNVHLTNARAQAKLKIITVSTRSGQKHSSYELINLASPEGNGQA